jgi:TPR repeat protein
MKLVYLANLAPTRSTAPVITEAERKTLLQILEGGKNGAHFKKITDNIWSARLNKRARFLIMLTPTVTIVLEKFRSHKDYIEKLKNKNLCQHYLGHLTSEQIQAIFSEDAPQSQASEFTPEELTQLKEAFAQAPEEVYFSLGGKLVALSEQQKACTKPYMKTGNTSVTRLIQGGPGTGKTLVLISSFEKAYLEATQQETKHSSEALYQFIYLTTTPKLSENIGTHLETVLPKHPQPFLSMSYQDFACMVDPTLNPNPEISDPSRPKGIVGEDHFISWCEKTQLYKIDPDETGCHRTFYKKLYTEFRIISGCNNTEEYKQLGVCESSFQKDPILRKIFFKLYTDYIKKYVDLNFYDLTPAILAYKAKQSEFFTPKLFIDETQNLSRRQILNLIEYAKESENITLALDLNQRVYDSVPNAEFIQRYWLNRNVKVDNPILTEYYRVPKAVAKTLNKLSRLIEVFNEGVDCKTPSLITCTKKTALGNISQTLYSQLNGKVAEHYKELSARPNCIVVVGDPSLLTEAKNTFDNTDFIYTLDGAEDGIIGLEADYIIGYKILTGFSTEELQLLLPLFKDDTGCTHKPKDKNDKSKQALVLKLHQLYVGLSRPLKEFMFIVNDKSEPKPSSKTQKKQPKPVDNPEIIFMSSLLAAEKPENQQENPVEIVKPTITKEALHQEWVEACRTRIQAKDYEMATAICKRQIIKPEELNLSHEQRLKIPKIYHGFFFKPEPVCDQESKKPATKTKSTKGSKKVNYSANMLPFLNKLLEDFTEKRIEKLFQYTSSTIATALFQTSVNGNKFWNILNETQKQTIYHVLNKDNTHENIIKFIKIAEQCPQMLCDFAECQTNSNTALNRIYACMLYEAADRLNFPYAQFKLGLCYQYGHGKTKDLIEAVKFYQKASRNGEPKADEKLAYCYEYGLGELNPNLPLAAALYKSAVEKGVKTAYYYLGLCYVRGKGIEINIQEAIKYFELSDRECNSAKAQFQLGIIYLEGIATEQNPILAKKYFMKSIDNGNIEAYNNLARYYENIEKNNVLAFDCYSKGSVKGNPRAHYNLGRCYYYGFGIKEDRNKAMRFFCLSASAGFVLPDAVQTLLDKPNQILMQEEPKTKVEEKTKLKC